MVLRETKQTPHNFKYSVRISVISTMSIIIGLDFGSHTSSIALWHEEKATYEVFADELGSRVIPCVVAYRGDEVIVGQAAVAQQHKNPSNTFLDIRDLILNPAVENVFVPALDKEISVQELVSHFFRNIHNQVKMQVGKVVRDCVMSIPCAIDESVKNRLYEAAQAGGIRIKSLVSDTACTLMAYGLDNAANMDSKVLVVDIGWGEAEAGLFSISKGLFFPISSSTSNEVSGKVLVKLLSDHCVRDFQRRSKQSCADNVRSMIRLRAQCEEMMKQLSTVQEASLDIDSLYEGIDYSGKVSRARFEDVAGIPLVQLKALINDALAKAGNLQLSDVSAVCVAGGLTAMPKILSNIKGMFPHALFPRVRFETAEALCIGAAFHARCLLEQVLRLYY